jgi:hypothetical protein
MRAQLAGYFRRAASRTGQKFRFPLTRFDQCAIGADSSLTGSMLHV